MIRRIAVAAGLTFLGLVMYCGQAAAATEVQDAACLVPSTNGFINGSPATGRLGENFTALHTGELTRAQISIDNATGTSDYVLDIRSLNGSDAPTENVLASATIPNASLPNGISNLTGTFSSPASVVAGHRYALAVSRPGGSDLRINVNNTNPCADGQLFLNSGAGAVWSAQPSYDAIFAVFVTPPTPPTGERAAALKKCKKKHSKRARRKCRKKANLLPV